MFIRINSTDDTKYIPCNIKFALLILICAPSCKFFLMISYLTIIWARISTIIFEDLLLDNA